jgi:putative DNA-invertase from lambdoid prophage Rac
MVACHRLQVGFVSPMCAALYACVSMHDQYTLAMQIDAMRACATQRHWTVADTVEEVASDATDHRPKRQVHLKTATQRQRDVMLV